MGLRYTRFAETIWSLTQADRNTFHYFQVCSILSLFLNGRVMISSFLKIELFVIFIKSKFTLKSITVILVEYYQRATHLYFTNVMLVFLVSWFWQPPFLSISLPLASGFSFAHIFCKRKMKKFPSHLLLFCKMKLSVVLLLRCLLFHAITVNLTKSFQTIKT